MRRIAVLLVLSTTIAQASFNKIVVIGDSLSDMGNTNSGTLGIQPGSAYWQGRFSNGPVWIERLAALRSISIARSTNGGTNWAYGGAETGTGTFGFLFIQLPNMTTQTTRYLNTNPVVDAATLYIVYGGANDYFDGQTNVSVPTGNIQSIVQTLYNRGARQFLIPNLPWLGNTPRYLGTADENTMNQRAIQHNASLASRITNLRSTLQGILIYDLDVASAFDDIRTHPSAYGLTNVTQPAYNGTSTVSNADQYLFFDEVHPTRVIHVALGDLANQLVADPATISGTITLQNFGGATSGETVKVEFLNSSGAILESKPAVALDTSGHYILTTKQFGATQIRVSGRTWLSKVVGGLSLAEGQSVLADASLINGDVDGDNEVGPSDFGVLSAAFGTLAGDSGYDADADLDGDGEVGPSDFGILAQSFGSVGE